MTAHYARLSDKTVGEHWERDRKENAQGQPVQLSPVRPQRIQFRVSTRPVRGAR
jgi:hypothetical protein